MHRRLAGWCVGAAYALAGARMRAVRRLKAGAILPVVVHALPAGELERLLSWLERAGVLDRLWLTFDDGWATVMDSIPVLERFGVKAKVFVAPGETMRGKVWTSAAGDAGVPDRVWRGWYGLGESERYEKLEAALRDLRGSAGQSRTAGMQRFRLLTKEEVIEISRHPLIDIENHTWSHLSATHRPAEEVADEVARAQVALTEWTGRAPEWLAWPFGRGTPELDEMARAMGLKTVYTRQGYELPYCRNMVLAGMSFQENLGRMLGAWPKVGETI